MQINRGKHANAGLPVAAGIVISRVADQIIWDAPLVGVDALDDAGPAQRLQPPDMGIDIALIVAAGNAALEFRLLQMAARPIDAVLGDGGDGAVGRSRCRLGRVDAGDMVGPAVDPVHHDCQVLAQLVGQVLVHDAADDGRLGRSVMDLEAHGIAFAALRAERLLHGADNVAALA